MTTKILAVDITGSPIKWLSFEDAIYRVANKKVAWSLGNEKAFHFRGGMQNSGVQSEIFVPPIIALVRSEGMSKHRGEIRLGRDNYELFKRDRFMCTYCGKTGTKLTRDHIFPKSRGGKDTFANCTSACLSCNGLKGNKTPEEAKMPLLMAPYVPNQFEKFILSGRSILADQMDYLVARVSKQSRHYLDA